MYNKYFSKDDVEEARFRATNLLLHVVIGCSASIFCELRKRPICGLFGVWYFGEVEVYASAFGSWVACKSYHCGMWCASYCVASPSSFPASGLKPWVNLHVRTFSTNFLSPSSFIPRDHCSVCDLDLSKARRQIAKSDDWGRKGFQEAGRHGPEHPEARTQNEYQNVALRSKTNGINQAQGARINLSNHFLLRDGPNLPSRAFFSSNFQRRGATKLQVRQLAWRWKKGVESWIE